MNYKSSGFTLIELLIAISILSALLFTGTYTYQMMAGRWDKELGEFEGSVKTAKHFSLLNNLLKGIHPFIVMDEQVNTKKPAFLFIGHEQSLLSTSRAGLFSQPYPEIFRLTSRQKENGLYDLIYQSVSSKDTLLLTAQHEIKFDNQLVLFSDLDEISFNYLGWDSFAAQSGLTQGGIKPTWRTNFSGIDNQLIPVRMLLTLISKQREMNFTIVLDQNSLRYLTPYFDAQYD